MWEFIKLLGEKNCSKKSLKTIIKESLLELSKFFNEEKRYKMPSAAGTIIRINKEDIEIAVYADTYTLIELDDKILKIVDERIVNLDKLVIKKLIKLIKEGFSREEALTNIRKDIIVNRNKMCKEYSVIAPIKNCEPYFYEKFPINNVKKIISSTDGFWSRLMDLELVRDLKELLYLDRAQILNLASKIFELGKIKIIKEYVEEFYPLDDASFLEIVVNK